LKTQSPSQVTRPKSIIWQCDQCP